MKSTHSYDDQFVNNNSLAYTANFPSTSAKTAGNDVAKNGRHRHRVNNKKLKAQQLRTVANSYLSNIALDGYVDDEVKNEYYEKVITNRFDCFLTFNRIATQADRQSEYFNYYKQRLVNEKKQFQGGKKSEFETFLSTEFISIDVSSFQPDVYISHIFESNKIGEQQNEVKVPTINIVLSTTFTEQNELKNMQKNGSNKPADLELEYIQSQTVDLNTAKRDTMIQQSATSNITLSSTSSISIQQNSNNNNKLAQSLNSALLTISNKIGQKPTTAKSPLDEPPIEDLQKVPVERLRRPYRRTISESSNESAVLLLHNKSSNAGPLQFPYSSQYSTQTNSRAVAGYKPSLFGNLKKLNNEKLVFTSNSAPLGMFARLPFRLNSIKSDLNDSFIKTRHLSVNKTGTQHSNFILEVFEFLELDFQEYSNTGIMSYSNLIDPVYRLLKSSKQSKESGEQAEQNGERPDDKGDEDKDEMGMEIVGKSLFKREVSPFLITAYHPDYLDDPQLTELTAGKNRTCLKFASYSVSIIDYVKPLDLKKEINETFKEKFPHVQITLTKLRSIKRELYEIAQDTGLDFVIVAQAYIYFEKLILQGLINKGNRKYLAGDCLILAAKLNDTGKKDLNKLIDNIMDKFRFDSRKDLIAYEFAILVALEFNLIIKYETEFVKHYERLQNNIDLVLNRDKHNGRVFSYQKDSEK